MAFNFDSWKKKDNKNRKSSTVSNMQSFDSFKSERQTKAPELKPMVSTYKNYESRKAARELDAQPAKSQKAKDADAARFAGSAMDRSPKSQKAKDADAARFGGGAQRQEEQRLEKVRDVKADRFAARYAPDVPINQPFKTKEAKTADEQRFAARYSKENQKEVEAARKTAIAPTKVNKPIESSKTKAYTSPKKPDAKGYYDQGKKKADVLKNVIGSFKGFKDKDNDNDTVAEKFGASVRSGIGKAIESTGDGVNYVAKKTQFGVKNEDDLWLKAGKAIQKSGQKISDGFEDTKYSKEFSKESLTDPEWYATSVTSALPSTISSLVPGLGAAKVLGNVNKIKNLPKIYKTIIQSVGGAGATTAYDSAVLSGGIYEEAKTRGMSEEEAIDAADKAFGKNFALTGGTTALEFGAGLLPFGKGISKLAKAGSIAARTTGGAGLEAFQEGGQAAIEADALGDDFKWTDPSTIEAMVIGGLMGGSITGSMSTYRALQKDKSQQQNPDGDFNETEIEIEQSRQNVEKEENPHEAILERVVEELPQNRRDELEETIFKMREEGYTYEDARDAALESMVESYPDVEETIAKAAVKYADNKRVEREVAGLENAPDENVLDRAKAFTPGEQVEFKGQTVTVKDVDGHQVEMETPEGKRFTADANAVNKVVNEEFDPLESDGDKVYAEMQSELAQEPLLEPIPEIVPEQVPKPSPKPKQAKTEPIDVVPGDAVQLKGTSANKEYKVEEVIGDDVKLITPNNKTITVAKSKIVAKLNQQAAEESFDDELTFEAAPEMGQAESVGNVQVPPGFRNDVRNELNERVNDDGMTIDEAVQAMKDDDYYADSPEWHGVIEEEAASSFGFKGMVQSEPEPEVSKNEIATTKPKSKKPIGDLKPGQMVTVNGKPYEVVRDLGDGKVTVSGDNITGTMSVAKDAIQEVLAATNNKVKDVKRLADLAKVELSIAKGNHKEAYDNVQEEIDELTDEHIEKHGFDAIKDVDFFESYNENTMGEEFNNPLTIEEYNELSDLYKVRGRLETQEDTLSFDDVLNRIESFPIATKAMVGKALEKLQQDMKIDARDNVEPNEKSTQNIVKALYDSLSHSLNGTKNELPEDLVGDVFDAIDTALNFQSSPYGKSPIGLLMQVDGIMNDAFGIDTAEFVEPFTRLREVDKGVEKNVVATQEAKEPTQALEAPKAPAKPINWKKGDTAYTKAGNQKVSVVKVENGQVWVKADKKLGQNETGISHMPVSDLSKEPHAREKYLVDVKKGDLVRDKREGFSKDPLTVVDASNETTLMIKGEKGIANRTIPRKFLEQVPGGTKENVTDDVQEDVTKVQEVAEQKKVAQVEISTSDWKPGDKAILGSSNREVTIESIKGKVAKVKNSLGKTVVTSLASLKREATVTEKPLSEQGAKAQKEVIKNKVADIPAALENNNLVNELKERVLAATGVDDVKAWNAVLQEVIRNKGVDPVKVGQTYTIITNQKTSKSVTNRQRSIKDLFVIEEYNSLDDIKLVDRNGEETTYNRTQINKQDLFSNERVVSKPFVESVVKMTKDKDSKGNVYTVTNGDKEVELKTSDFKNAKVLSEDVAYRLRQVGRFFEAGFSFTDDGATRMTDTNNEFEVLDVEVDSSSVYTVRYMLRDTKTGNEGFFAKRVEDDRIYDFLGKVNKEAKVKPLEKHVENAIDFLETAVNQNGSMTFTKENKEAIHFEGVHGFDSEHNEEVKIQKSDGMIYTRPLSGGDWIESGVAYPPMVTEEQVPAPAPTSDEPKTAKEEMVSFRKKMRDGDYTAKDLQEHFQFVKNNEEEVTAHFMDLVNNSEQHKRKRKDTKEKYVKRLYDDALQRPAYGDKDMLTIRGGDIFASPEVQEASRLKQLEKIINSITDESIAEYLEKQNAERAKEQKALDNPETLEEYRTKLSSKDGLTAEEQAKFDELTALKTRELDAKKKTAAVTSSVSKGDYTITADKDTRDGSDIWIVKTKDKLEKEAYTELNRHMKSLGGFYSRFKKGFLFKEDPTAKLDGEVTESEVVDQTESNQTRIADKLRAVADKMQETIDDKRRDTRKTNTFKRAREDGNARAEADKMERQQGIMKRVADAIGSGEATFLDNVTARTHFDTLDHVLWLARRERLNKKENQNLRPSEREKMEREPITVEEINAMELPKVNIYADNLQNVVKAMEGTTGLMRVLAKLTKEINAAKVNSNHMIDGEKNREDVMKVVDAAIKAGKEIYAAQSIKERYNDLKRLEVMKLNTPALLRSGVREYIRYTEDVGENTEQKEKDRKRKREAELSKMKISGFFPTPSKIIDRMLSEADIQPGMTVLEPSAGKGNIAERIRDEHADATLDVVEYDYDLNEYLESLEYNVVGKDFMEHTGEYDRIVMNPPFEKGQDIDHVRHAYEMLKPGGRVVAIMSEGPFYRSDKKATSFREWLEENEGQSEKLDEGSFKDSERSTGVNTRMVVLEKPEVKDAAITITRKEPFTMKIGDEVLEYDNKKLKKVTVKEITNWNHRVNGKPEYMFYPLETDLYDVFSGVVRRKDEDEKVEKALDDKLSSEKYRVKSEGVNRSKEDTAKLLKKQNDLEDMINEYVGPKTGRIVQKMITEQNRIKTLLETPEPKKKVFGGNKSEAFTENGTKIEFEYRVVEASDLIASNDSNGNVNPDYPQELQPRDRSRKASQVQIQNIAQKLNPVLVGESSKASDGAPIVGPDMVVESGNGRTIAMKKMYENNYDTVEAYDSFLAQNADKFGLDYKVLENMENPILVRVRTNEVDRKQFVSEANEASVSAMSAAEQATADADKMNNKIMSLFAPGENGELNTVTNHSFIVGFISEVVAKSERGRYMTADGKLSQEGLIRVRNAVFAKAYGNSEAISLLAESTDNNVRNVTNAMLQSAPRFAIMKDDIKNGELYDEDITGDIVDAMVKLGELRSEGTPVQTFLDQITMFDDMSPEAKEMLNILDDKKFKRSSKALSELFQKYVDVLEVAGSPNQIKLFEETPPTKAELLAVALKRVNEDVQTSLFETESESSNETRTRNEKNREKPETKTKPRPTYKPIAADGEIIAVGKPIKYKVHDTLASYQRNVKGNDASMGAASPATQTIDFSPKFKTLPIEDQYRTYYHETGHIVEMRLKYTNYLDFNNEWEAASRVARSDMWDLYDHNKKLVTEKKRVRNDKAVNPATNQRTNVTFSFLEQYLNDTSEQFADAYSLFETNYAKAVELMPNTVKLLERYHNNKEPFPEVEVQVNDQVEYETVSNNAVFMVKGEVKSISADKQSAWVQGKNFTNEVKVPIVVLKVLNHDPGRETFAEPEAKAKPKAKPKTKSNPHEEGFAGFKNKKEDSRRMDGTEEVDSEPIADLSRTKILQFISKEFKLTIGQGKLRGKQGVYKNKFSIIRTKEYGQFEVIAHELGHHLDKIARYSSNPKIRAELIKFAEANLQLPESMPKSTRAKEGVAEYYRQVFYNETAANVNIKDLSQALKQEMADGLTKAKLVTQTYELKRMMKAWLNRDAKTELDGTVSRIGSRTKSKKTRTRMIDEMYTNWFEEGHPIWRAIKDVEKETGKKVEGKNDAYALYRLTRGTTARAAAFTSGYTFDSEGNKTGESFEDILKEVDDLEEFGQYLVARRGLHLIEKRGKSKTPLSQDLMREHIKAESPKYKALAQRVYDYQDRLMHTTLVEGGLIDPKLPEKLRELDPYYVPFYRVMTEDGSRTDKGSGGSGGSIANQQQGIKRMKEEGSARDIINPIESIIKNTHLMFAITDRNSVGVALSELANPDSEFASEVARDIIEEIPNSFTVTDVALDQMKKALIDSGLDEDIMEELDLSQTAKVFNPLFKPNTSQNEILVWKEGKPKLYKIRDDMLYNALVVGDNVLLNKLTGSLFWKGAEASNKVLRWGIVSSPYFTVRTFARSLVQMTVKTEATGFNYWTQPFRMLSAMKSVISKDDVMYDWWASGGAQSTFIAVENEYINKSLDHLAMNRKAKDMAMGRYKPKSKEERIEMSKYMAKSIILSPFNVMQQFNDVLDQSLKLAEFKVTNKQTGDRQKSAIASRDADLDYRRMGAAGIKQYNAVNLFFNVSLQGPDNIARTFANHPVRTTLRGFTFLTLPTILLYLANRDDEEYQELETWEKDMNWVFKLDDGKFLKVPIPFEVGLLFKTLPEKIVGEAMDMKKGEDKHTWDNGFNNMAKTMIPSVLPTIATIFANYKAEKDLTNNRPYVPMGLQSNDDTLEYNEKTSPIMKWAGKVLNKSPMVLEQTFYSQFGQMGTLGLFGADALLGNLGVVEKKPDTKGILMSYSERYVKASVNDGGTGSITSFYDKKAKLEAEKEKSGIKFYDSPELDSYQQANDDLRDLRKVRAAIISDKLTPGDGVLFTKAEKKFQVDAINNGMRDIARYVQGKEPIDPESLQEALMIMDDFAAYEKIMDKEARRHAKELKRQDKLNNQ
jgi:hypothetical protein